jgi:hypothetical protein
VDLVVIIGALAVDALMIELRLLRASPPNVRYAGEEAFLIGSTGGLSARRKPVMNRAGVTRIIRLRSNSDGIRSPTLSRSTDSKRLPVGQICPKPSCRQRGTTCTCG